MLTTFNLSGNTALKTSVTLWREPLELSKRGSKLRSKTTGLYFRNKLLFLHSPISFLHPVHTSITLKCQMRLHMAMYRHTNQREMQLNSRASSRRDTCFLFNFFSLCSCLLYCPSPLFLQLVLHISLLLLYSTWFPPLSTSSIVESLQKERATLDGALHPRKFKYLRYSYGACQRCWHTTTKTMNIGSTLTHVNTSNTH